MNTEHKVESTASYKTIVVGTDGSPSSLRAVKKAADVAACAGARLVICCAYASQGEKIQYPLAPQEGTSILGEDPAEKMLSAAVQVAQERGVQDIEQRRVPGTPVEALIATVESTDAELLVVGNRGINSLSGRLLGSVPAEVARLAHCDVLIANTRENQEGNPRYKKY